MDKSCLNSYTKKHLVSNQINESNLFYMGFELELVEGPEGVDTDELEQLVRLATDADLLAKYDGSVDAELVSRPLLIDELKEKVKETLSLVSESSPNWVSWDQSSEYSSGGRCGFHLHVNRKSIKNIKNIYQFLKFYESEFKILSGRKNLYYCRLDPDYMNKNYKKYHSNRYSAINNLNPHTLEFRLWRGSLNYDRLCFYIDLTWTICRYSGYIGSQSMTLAELLFLTNNNFTNCIFSKIKELSGVKKEYETIKRFFSFKNWKTNLRNLNRYRKIKDLNGLKYASNIEKHEEKTEQQQDNNQVACF